MKMKWVWKTFQDAWTLVVFSSCNKHWDHCFPPVRTSPAPCGRFAGSETAWPGSRSVLQSYLHRRRRWPQQRQPRPQTLHLSPVRPHPLPEACCPVASAGDLEAPPPGRRGYWALQRTDTTNMTLNTHLQLNCKSFMHIKKKTVPAVASSRLNLLKYDCHY